MWNGLIETDESGDQTGWGQRGSKELGVQRRDRIAIAGKDVV